MDDTIVVDLASLIQWLFARLSGVVGLLKWVSYPHHYFGAAPTISIMLSYRIQQAPLFFSSLLVFTRAEACAAIGAIFLAKQKFLAAGASSLPEELPNHCTRFVLYMLYAICHIRWIPRPWGCTFLLFRTQFVGEVPGTIIVTGLHGLSFVTRIEYRTGANGLP